VKEVVNINEQDEKLSINCYFNQLSDQFNVTLNGNYISEDTSYLFVVINEKLTKKRTDSIQVSGRWLIVPPMYANCEDVRSYTTGVNVHKEVFDNCPGDFIVADFNFDGLDDFAVAVDNGGNGGYIYSYYLQKRNKRFELDQFLSGTMERFPVSFNEKEKTLTTSVHANAYENCETIYQLKSGNWKETNRKFVK
jgi:hypothetical protein